MIRRRSVYTSILTSLALVLASCSSKPEPAEVLVTLDSAATSLSSATVLVDYSQAGATPVRSGGDPACASIVPNLTAHFSDDGQGRITIHASAPQGFSAPIDLAVCRMTPDAPDLSAETISSRLRVSLVAAADASGEPLDEQRLASLRPSDRRAETRRQGSRTDASRDSTAEGAPSRRRDREEPLDSAQEREAGDTTAPEDRVATAPRPGGRDSMGGGEAAPPGDTSSRPLRDAARGSAAGGGQNSGSGTDGKRPSDDEAAGKADANEDSDTDRAAVAYAVTVGVTNAAGSLGALQFDIIHRGASGGFAGAAGSAKCNAEASSLSSFNDRGNGTLSGAVIDLDGIKTPSAIATCTFKSRDPVSATDFTVKVVDASNPEGDPPMQYPQMAVVNLRAAP